MIINLTAREQSALAGIDERELDELIDAAISKQQTSGFFGVSLSDCGAYVTGVLRKSF